MEKYANKHATIGNICREFRTHTLKLTLKQVAVLTNHKVPTISKFENGNSTNINRLFIYLQLGTTEQQNLLLSQINERLIKEV